jgi:hypothetical protein
MNNASWCMGGMKYVGTLHSVSLTLLGLGINVCKKKALRVDCLASLSCWVLMPTIYASQQ